MSILLPLAFMGFGFTELLVVGFVALLVFGGDLPNIMRNLGKAYAKFRQGLHEVSRPIREEIRQVREATPPAPSLEATLRDAGETAPMNTPTTGTDRSNDAGPSPEPAKDPTVEYPSYDEPPPTPRRERYPGEFSVDDEPPPV